jgi:hypothetical protein
MSAQNSVEPPSGARLNFFGPGSRLVDWNSAPVSNRRLYLDLISLSCLQPMSSLLGSAVEGRLLYPVKASTDEDEFTGLNQSKFHMNFVAFHFAV